MISVQYSQVFPLIRNKVLDYFDNILKMFYTKRKGFIGILEFGDTSIVSMR